MVHVIAEVPQSPVIGLNIEVAVEPGTANTGLYTEYRGGLNIEYQPHVKEYDEFGTGQNWP